MLRFGSVHTKSSQTAALSVLWKLTNDEVSVMTTVISTKAWGGAKLSADGKIKTWRRAKDASQKQRWRKSKRVTAISRKTAAKLARP